jgi:hypothetical protein
MKKLLLGLILVSLSTAAALLVAEGYVRYSQYSVAERSAGAEKLWRSFRNSYIETPDANNPDCSYTDSLVPHPYLGFVHHRLECGFSNTNNRGFTDDRDIPFRRDPEYFTVLLVGGSVAAQMASGSRNQIHHIWLEDALNQNFVSPNGKPFRVLSGALGAWKVPTQTNAVTLYGPFVDAVVALDGYNEAASSTYGHPVDLPDTWVYRYVTRSNLNGQDTWKLRLARRYRNFAVQSAVLRHSFLAYFVFNRAMWAIAAAEDPRANYETLDRFFELPASWTTVQRDDWNRERFENYDRETHGVTRALGILYAHFLQPTRLFYKPLSEEEKVTVEPVTAEHFKSIYVRAIEDLKREGAPVASLLDVFAGKTETLYDDHIHCKFTPDGENPGYELIARRMAQDLRTLWHLKAKRG